MLPARLTPTSILAEQRRVDADLARDKGEHRRRRRFQGLERAARVPERAKLDSEAQAIGRAPLGSHDGQVFGAEHVVPSHLGLVDRDVKQASTLLGRQQGATGHGGLLLMAEDRS